jgi:hypothetical protein
VTNGNALLLNVAICACGEKSELKIREMKRQTITGNENPNLKLYLPNQNVAIPLTSSYYLGT